jgi:hypothetical protein
MIMMRIMDKSKGDAAQEISLANVDKWMESTVTFLTATTTAKLEDLKEVRLYCILV